ncbi:hypothetical protein OQ708_24530, partial [Mycobacterium ulcerans]|nr:hypothetical protein [Mycobacterium ulcerans]MEB3925691.1 hypothetical protein [Mycobacterium ulcerans]MEB3929820.1 hypothetical protein [Mycobacterium ulcerans]MEB3938096.1 hypothetical protein [Mycobacterium ulcerans]MEB3948347.1 hypothetical protein [Mycobacterium ulcerans]
MNAGSGGDSGVGEAGTIGCRNRPVRGIVGIPADLCKLPSSRRNAIKPRYEELVAYFQLAHDHKPTTSEQFSRAPALLISRLVSWVDDLWCRAIGA